MDIGELAGRTREFIRDVIIPVEEETGGSVHAAPDELRRSLQSQARAAGLFAPQLPVRWGGHGLDLRGQSVVFGFEYAQVRRRELEEGQVRA